MANQPKLEEIARRVLGESALEVYVWASGVPELNDVCLGDRFSTCDNYVRAVHNVSDSKLELLKICSLSSMLYSREEVDGIANKNPPFNSLNVVAYGPAKCTEIKGLIFKKEVEKTAPLIDLVKNGDSRDAYFMKFVINADIRDSAGRNSPNFPVLTIVAPEQVVEQVVGYLRQNPQQYESVVKAILPKSMFPKVNSGILSQIRVTGRLVLLDTERVPRDNQKSMAEKVRKYGLECPKDISNYS